MAGSAEFNHKFAQGNSGDGPIAFNLGAMSWLRVMIVCATVFEVAAFAKEHSFLILTISGWASWAFSHLIEQHYKWVFVQLMPLTSYDDVDSELDSLRLASAFWRPVYMKVHTAVTWHNRCMAQTLHCTSVTWHGRYLAWLLYRMAVTWP